MKKNILSKSCTVVCMSLVISLIFSSLVFAGMQDSARININDATVQELAKLPGIGKKKAEAIVVYRQEKGKFKSIEELQKVEGIGKKTLEKIKMHLTAEGS